MFQRASERALRVCDRKLSFGGKIRSALSLGRGLNHTQAMYIHFVCALWRVCVRACMLGCAPECVYYTIIIIRKH